jgi:hypothetical protein
LQVEALARYNRSPLQGRAGFVESAKKRTTGMVFDTRSYGPSGALRWAVVISYAVGAICLLACSATQLWFVPRDQPIGIDEGYMAALGLRLLDGNMLPGVDGVGQRGPVLYWMVAIFQWLFGPHHWFGIRILAWTINCAVIMALLFMGALARKPIAGSIAAVFYVYTTLHRYDLGAGIGVGGEQSALPWLCWATVMTGLSRATDDARKQVVRGVVAGVLAGLAGWTKVTLLLSVAPLALWVLAGSLRVPKRGVRGHAMALVPLVAGWLALNFAIVLPYAASGHLGDLSYRFFVYNRDIHMGAYAGVAVTPLIARWIQTDPWTSGSWLACAAGLFVHLGHLIGTNRGRGFVATVAAVDFALVALLQAALGFAMGIVQMRFWPHHFIAALPWAGLAFGLGLDWLISTWPVKLRAGVALLGLLSIGAGLGWTATRAVQAREVERTLGSWKPAREERLCSEIQRLSRPQDYIFVWGFDADLYVSCGRRPASRFVYATLIAGLVPPFWDQPRAERVARGAVKQTLADFRKTKPSLIVNITDWVGHVPITSIPELRAVVEKQYCKLKGVGGKSGRRARIYARLDTAHCGSALPSSE